MARSIEQMLKDAGQKGISFSTTDPNLKEVKKEITQLRRRGYQIVEKVEAESSFSPFKRKRIRYVIEADVYA